MPRQDYPRTARLYAGLCAAFALSSTPFSLFAAEVMNCGDGGPGSGSLRDVIAGAAPGETIDLSQLPTKCGMADSVITLSNGEVKIAQDNLKLQGPSKGSVTIALADGSYGRVLDHTGTGLLVINDLSIANGYIQAVANFAEGGCIRSDGSVFLSRSVVENCTAVGGASSGGGIFARSTVLLQSTVSGNRAKGPAGRGGGVFVWEDLTVLYSTLSQNEASEFGGGAFTPSPYSKATYVGYTSIFNSTLEGNTASHCAAATFYSPQGVTISNSTISGNVALDLNGGLCVEGTVTIANSTIAFNASASDSGGLGIWNGSLVLQSSILAHNGSNPGVPDLLANMGTTIAGADNLIMSASGNIPSGVIKLTSDPKLNPQLRFNGGPTRTHALLPGSPAIAAGNDSAGLWFDQRGPGYPRFTGPNSTTDIGAFQFDSIFYDDFDG